MTWLLTLFMACSPQAEAITNGQTGYNIGLSGALDLGGEARPLQFTTQYGVGMPITFWRGHYDPSFALGRYWGGGLTPRVFWNNQRVRLSLPVRVERGMDLIAIGIRIYGGLGPLLEWNETHQSVGVTAHMGATVKYRVNKNLGPMLSIQGGCDILDGAINPRLEFRLGLDFSARIRPPSSVDNQIQ